MSVMQVESFQNGSDSWGFVKPENNKGNTQLNNKQTLPTTLRIGDFNMDGYPDVLVVLQVSSER